MSKTINQVAIIGAGTMGSSIAALLAAANLDVWLLDILPSELTEAESSKGLTRESREHRNRLALAGVSQMKNPRTGMLLAKSHLDRIHAGNMTDDLEVLSDCDWIIEVVVEKLSIKQQVMKTIASVRKPGSIVTSNTSGVSITEIVKEESDEFKAHFLGTHFFNPPRYMKLLEVIPTIDTDPQLVANLATFFEKELGKEVVIAKDTPNFIGNRIGTFAYIDVMKQMEVYDFDIPTTDLLSGKVIGRPASATFRTADMVGIDILKNVANNVVKHSENQQEIKDYTPPHFVDEMIAVGALGNKTKGGFYKKVVRDGKRIFLVRDIKTGEYQPVGKSQVPAVESALASDNKYASMAFGQGVENQFVWEILRNTLLYSASLVPEITDDYQMIDKAMRAGFNWELGPFEIWDKLGFEKTLEAIKADGKTVPTWVLKRAEAGYNGFYTSETLENSSEATMSLLVENKGAKIWETGDAVLLLEICSKGHVIDADVITLIEEAVTMLNTNYEGLIISSKGKNFSVGADLATIQSLISAEKWTELEKLVERLQRANMSLRYASKPVITTTFGMTLGGGAEVSMHSDWQVAYPETYFGLVEVGVGLVPGGGGCKEMVRRSSQRLAHGTKQEWVADMLAMWQVIAMGQVSSSSFDACEKGYLMPTEVTQCFNQETLVSIAKEKIRELNQNGYHRPVEHPIKVLGSTGIGALKMQINGMKDGQFISEYDAYLAEKVAYILCGGNLPLGTQVTEEYLLGLERETFLALCQQEKTQERIKHMLTTGKPLRN